MSDGDKLFCSTPESMSDSEFYRRREMEWTEAQIREQRRFDAAKDILCAILINPESAGLDAPVYDIDGAARIAIKYADALLEEMENR